MLLNYIIISCEILSLNVIFGWKSISHKKDVITFYQTNNVDSACENNLDDRIQQCLAGLFFYEKDIFIVNKYVSTWIIHEILKQYHCRQYTYSLQCIHDTLTSCKTDKTTSAVQHYLSQPWALQYNTFCDINQQNSTLEHVKHTKLQHSKHHIKDNSEQTEIHPEGNSESKENSEKSEHYVGGSLDLNQRNVKNVMEMNKNVLIPSKYREKTFQTDHTAMSQQLSTTSLTNRLLFTRKDPDTSESM